MADDPKPETAKPTRLVRSKDFRVVFSNTFRMRNTVNDIGIAFGYNTELPSGSDGATQTLIQDEVEIVLTPAFLKILQSAIADNIEAIELELGSPIPLPQEIVDALSEARTKLLEEKTQKRELAEPSSKKEAAN